MFMWSHCDGNTFISRNGSHDTCTILALSLYPKKMLTWIKLFHFTRKQDKLITRHQYHIFIFWDFYYHSPHYWRPLCGEFIDYRWIPLKKDSDAELWCFLWSVIEQTEWTIDTRWFETPWRSLWRHCNDINWFSDLWCCAGISPALWSHRCSNTASRCQNPGGPRRANLFQYCH